MSFKIKAGETEAFCGETIRITGVCDDDPDEQRIVGLTGRITHPFPGLMLPNVEYIAGVWLDQPQGITMVRETNLVRGDTFEVIDAGTADVFAEHVAHDNDLRIVHID